MNSIEKDSKKTAKGNGREEAVFQYLTKKLEKITSALYLVTNFFSEEEPLRLSIREKSLSLLSNTFSLKEKVVSDPAHFTTTVSSTMREIVSLLRIAKDTGLISEMNFSVLDREFAGLFDLLGAPHDEYVLPKLSNTFFAVSDDTPPALIGKREAVKSPLLGPAVVAKRKEEDPQRVSGVKKRRRDHIIEVLRAQGSVSIADIAREIQGCSQKTIQRELHALVDAGEVIREGDRRWSRYKLSEKKEKTL